MLCNTSGKLRVVSKLYFYTKKLNKPETQNDFISVTYEYALFI